MAGDISVGNLIIGIKTRLDEFKNGMGTVKSDMDSLTKSIADNRESIRQSGLAFTALGASIVGALGLSIRAAAQQEEVFSHLQATIEISGNSWEGSKGKIDGFIESMQATTKYGDTDTARTLQRMMIYTTDLGKAMIGSKLAMDMAASGMFNVDTAARMIGMAMSGNIEILGRFIPEFKEANNESLKSMDANEKAVYALDVLQGKFKGLAEKELNTLNGQLASLGNYFFDISDNIGDIFLPTLTESAIKLKDFSKEIRDFTADNQELTKGLVITVGAFGGLSLVIGSLLLIAPGLAVLFTNWAAIFAVGGPIALGIIAITAALYAFIEANRKLSEIQKETGYATPIRTATETAMKGGMYPSLTEAYGVVTKRPEMPTPFYMGEEYRFIDIFGLKKQQDDYFGIYRQTSEKKRELTEEEEAFLLTTQQTYAQMRISLIKDENERKRAEIDLWYKDQIKQAGDNEAAVIEIKKTKALMLQKITQDEQEKLKQIALDAEMERINRAFQMEDEVYKKQLEAKKRYEETIGIMESVLREAQEKEMEKPVSALTLRFTESFKNIREEFNRSIETMAYFFSKEVLTGGFRNAFRDLRNMTEDWASHLGATVVVEIGKNIWNLTGAAAIEAGTKRFVNWMIDYFVGEKGETFTAKFRRMWEDIWDLLMMSKKIAMAIGKFIEWLTNRIFGGKEIETAMSKALEGGFWGLELSGVFAWLTKRLMDSAFSFGKILESSLWGLSNVLAWIENKLTTPAISFGSLMQTSLWGLASAFSWIENKLNTPAISFGNLLQSSIWGLTSAFDWMKNKLNSSAISFGNLLQIGLWTLDNAFNWLNNKIQIPALSFGNLLQTGLWNLSGAFDWIKNKLDTPAISFGGLLQTALWNLSSAFDWIRNKLETPVLSFGNLLQKGIWGLTSAFDWFNNKLTTPVINFGSLLESGLINALKSSALWNAINNVLNAFNVGIPFGIGKIAETYVASKTVMVPPGIEPAPPKGQTVLIDNVAALLMAFARIGATAVQGIGGTPGADALVKTYLDLLSDYSKQVPWVKGLPENYIQGWVKDLAVKYTQYVGRRDPIQLFYEFGIPWLQEARSLSPYAMGGIIPGLLGQAQAIIAHSGEGILNQKAVQNIGESGVNALNRGASAGDIINVYVTDNTILNDRDADKLADFVVTAISRKINRRMRYAIA